MSATGAKPLFVDTSAFFAHFYEKANRHDRARQVFRGIRDGELAYRPLYTSRYVIAELATLLRRKADPEEANGALTAFINSDIYEILSVNKPIFDEAMYQFGEYDDHQISFVDHLSAVLADQHDINHIFTFDGDFRTLGLTVVPDDTGEA